MNFTDSTGLQRDICGDDEMQNDPYCIYKRGGSGRWGIGMGWYWNGEYWNNVWVNVWIPSPPPGGGKQFDPRSLLPGMRDRAISGAVQILKKNSRCAAVFGNTGLKPEDLLEKLAAGDTDYGAIEYGRISSATTSATTQGIMVRPDANMKILASAMITLNDSTGSNWFLGSDDDRTLTILHELAHAFDVIFGPGTSSLPWNEAEKGIFDEEKLRRSIESANFIRSACSK